MISIEDRVRFVETDLMGVVHHANYLRWFEMGRIAYLRAAGIDLNDLMAAGIMFPIVAVECQYKNSAKFDDEYLICTTLSEFNRAKSVFSYKVLRKKDNLLLAEGTSRNVFTNLQGRITRLNNVYYQKIDALYRQETKEKKEC